MQVRWLDSCTDCNADRKGMLVHLTQSLQLLEYRVDPVSGLFPADSDNACIALPLHHSLLQLSLCKENCN